MAFSVRRVVTGHDDTGKSIFVSDGQPVQTMENEGHGQALVWATDISPALNNGSVDGGDRDMTIPPPANGTMFQIVEFPPEPENAGSDDAGGAEMKEFLKMMGAEVPSDPNLHPAMHKTKSIDYGVILDGEIDLVLEDSETHLTKGDVIVQRGTFHAWVNRSDQPCRIAFVLVDAEPAP